MQKPELTKEYILGAINARNDAAVNALLGLYARQTADEQNAQTTAHQNGMGFNGTDANILSSFAEQVEKKKARGVKAGDCLSEKQLALLRKKLPKYSRQLLEIAQEKAEAKAAGSSPTGEEKRSQPAPEDYGNAGERVMVEYEISADSPLSHLPSGYVQEGNGWRMKTARDFHNEGVRLDLNIGSMIGRAEPLTPISEFERCFMA